MNCSNFLTFISANEFGNSIRTTFDTLFITVLKHQGKDLVTTEQPLTIEPIGMALPPGDPQFLNLVQNYLASLELSGTLQLLEKKWFNDGAWMLNVE